ncbi:MAG: hypothetical protein Q7U57_12360 [Methylovulum sp.]|nr:hypothetical protein [Methylovulum sp.]
MLKRLSRLLILVTLAWCQVATAELVLIANAAIHDAGISREQAVNIYMGRLRRFPSGAAAVPLDLPADGTEKALFYRLLLNKSLSDIGAYWARLLFSGRTAPPHTVGSPPDVVNYVAANPNAVGYVDRSVVDSRVKIMLELPVPGDR